MKSACCAGDGLCGSRRGDCNLFGVPDDIPAMDRGSPLLSNQQNIIRFMERLSLLLKAGAVLTWERIRVRDRKRVQAAFMRALPCPAVFLRSRGARIPVAECLMPGLRTRHVRQSGQMGAIVTQN